MGALITVVIIVAVMLLGKFFMDRDNDDHDEWRGF